MKNIKRKELALKIELLEKELEREKCINEILIDKMKNQIKLIAQGVEFQMLASFDESFRVTKRSIAMQMAVNQSN